MESSPFRRACNACSKAKSRCNGENPCSACQKKAIACVFAFKRKRGPAKRGGDRAASSEQREQLISPFERRLWTAFFTIFKNQDREQAQNEKGVAWCWFAKQLELLRSHCEELGNESLASRIHSFLESMDIKMKAITAALEKGCPFSPAICSDCSTMVLLPHSAASVVHSNSTAQSFTLDPSVDTSTDVDSYPRQGFAARLFDQYNDNSQAAVVFKQTDHPKSFSISVNDKFEELFGLSSKQANELLAWTGNGFLPWAADLIAKVIVSETDLITFLQIMCLKFQSVGICCGPELVLRDVPSSHSFKFWVQRDGEYRQEQCLLSCSHRILKSASNLSNSTTFVFVPLGEPHSINSNESGPVGTETGTSTPSHHVQGGASTDTFLSENAVKAEVDDFTEEPEFKRGRTFEQEGTCDPGSVIESLELPELDIMPEEPAKYYDRWEQVSSYDLEYVTSPASSALSPNQTLTENDENMLYTDFSPNLENDSSWLEDLLLWYDEPPPQH